MKARTKRFSTVVLQSFVTSSLYIVNNRLRDFTAINISPPPYKMIHGRKLSWDVEKYGINVVKIWVLSVPSRPSRPSRGGGKDGTMSVSHNIIFNLFFFIAYIVVLASSYSVHLKNARLFFFRLSFIFNSFGFVFLFRFEFLHLICHLGRHTRSFCHRSGRRFMHQVTKILVQVFWPHRNFVRSASCHHSGT